MKRWLALALPVALASSVAAQPLPFPFSGVGNVFAVTVGTSDTIVLQPRDSFTAAISGTTMTVSVIAKGSSLGVGQVLFGTSTALAAGTAITAFGTGTGLTGTYTISPNQTIASEPMTSAGTPWIFLALALQHSTAVVRCAFGTPALAADTAGQITLNGSYASVTYDSNFIPNDVVHCISSVSSTPLTVIAR